MSNKHSVALAGVLMLIGAGCGTQVPETETPDVPTGAQETTAEEPTQTEPTAEPEPSTEQPAPSASSAPTSDPSAETGDTAPAQEGARSDRGNIIKEVGEPAGLDGDNGEPIAEFTLTDIETDFDCPSDIADKPANGQFVALSFEVKTYPALAQQEYVDSVSISEYDMTVFAPDGTRENDSSGNALFCLDAADELPRDIGPGEQASGKIILDTAQESGIIVFDYYLVDGAQWEWSF